MEEEVIAVADTGDAKNATRAGAFWKKVRGRVREAGTGNGALRSSFMKK
jgi:hypothetical protein